MKNQVKIKVIKKDAAKPAEKSEVAAPPPEKDNTSKLTSTVSGWINEFKQRRHEETESAIEQFYS